MGTDSEVLRTLIQCGADVNLPAYDGKPPVSYGIRDIEMVRVLVKECGADINFRDNEGRTPLSYVREEHETLRAQLVELGAQL